MPSSSSQSSISEFNADSRSSDQVMSPASSETNRAASSLGSYIVIGNEISSSSSGLALTTENLTLHQHQIAMVPVPTLSAHSLPAMDGNISDYSHRLSSRDFEILTISCMEAPTSDTTNLSKEQSDDDCSPEKSEWHELLNALEVERKRVMILHSMSSMERFLSCERVEDCSVDLRVRATEQNYE